MLIIVTGPTAVGKTSFAVQLAQHYHASILSCDSRQFYREMRIGTAVPDDQQINAVPHYFIGNLSVTDYYNAATYETEALNLLQQLFLKQPVVILCGGSGLYINAVCDGIDELPDPDPEVRKMLKDGLNTDGLDFLRNKLRSLDPEYYIKVDKNNPNRMLRAVEVCLATGKPYSGFLQHQKKRRPFAILKLALDISREELIDRIKWRADQMIASGLLDEVRSLLPYRHLTALNTVGYREIFSYLDGTISLDKAIEKINTNTRRYAKRQLTWFRKDKDYIWLRPEELSKAIDLINLKLTFDDM